MEIKMKKNFLALIALVIMVGFTACSGQSSALIGDWKLVSYGSKSSPTPVVSDIDTTVTIGADGKVNGNVGCNSFGGDYKTSGEKISFSQIASTMMACADPLMQQESAVFTVFTDKATFSMDGSTLTITSADGNTVVVLSKK
jgi:heat shock protein HslJ